MPNFGKTLKSLRQSAKMTQQELAKELGIPKSAVSGYEQDARFPSASMLLKIADIFNISTDYLCGRVQERRTLDVTGLNAEDIEFLRTTIRFLKAKNNADDKMPLT